MASLDVIRTMTLRSKTEGVEQTTQQLTKLVDAQGKVVEASVATTKATLSVDKAVENLKRRYDTEYRAQQDLAKVAKTLDQARAQGLVTQEQSNALMQQAIRHHNTAATSVGAHAKALNELHIQAQAAAVHLGVLGGILSRLGPAGLGIAAAMGAVVFGLHAAGEAAKALAQHAGELVDLSDTIGVSVEKIQALQLGAAQVGISSEQLSTGLERFTASLDSIRKGAGGAFEAVERMSPALAKQVQAAKTVASALDLVFKALGQVDTAERAAAAKEIFGRGGIGMTRLAALTEAAGGVEQYTASMHEADRITAAQAKRLDELGDTIAESFKIAQQNLVLTFGEPMLQLIKTFSDQLLEMSRTLRELEPGVAFKDFMDWLIDPRLLEAISAIRNLDVSGLLSALRTAPGGGSPAGLPTQVPLPEIVTTGVEPKLAAATQATKDLRKAALEANDVLRANVTALGDAATAAEIYQSKLADLAKKLQDGTITQDTFNRAVAGLDPVVKQLQDVTKTLGDALVQAFINGQDAAQAFGSALKSLATTASSSAFDKIIKGISGQGFDLPSIATGGAIGIGAAVMHGLFGEPEAEEKQSKQEPEKESESVRDQYRKAA